MCYRPPWRNPKADWVDINVLVATIFIALLLPSVDTFEHWETLKFLGPFLNMQTGDQNSFSDLSFYSVIIGLVLP